MWARDGDHVLKGLEVGLKDSNNETRTKERGAEHCLFICLFFVILGTTRHRTPAFPDIAVGYVH